jgi:imidazolonepropionase
VSHRAALDLAECGSGSEVRPRGFHAFDTGRFSYARPVIADFVLRHAQPLLTCAGPAPRIGADMAQVASIDDGALAAREGRLLFVGPTEVCDRLVEQAPGALVIDASGCTVIPGLVDPHTHAVFAGDRRDELRRRLAGATYAEIAADGGGILRTVHATRAASVDELVEAGGAHLAEMLRAGTTTAEVKSGYGLTTSSEIGMLRAIARLAAEQPIELTATFMGAHEVPPEFKDKRDGYVRLLIDEMIPAVAAQHLAEWNDVFCERGVFTPDEAQQILDAGRRAGLMPRIHANELGETGGAQVAAQVGARSADHLVFVSDADIAALAQAGVVATLLPAASFYLKLGRFAPARRMIDGRVPVALATDVNPGGGFSPSMPFAMTLACFSMGLTFEEALNAATINAAYALDRHDRIGSLEPGKQCDVVIVRGAPTELLRIGSSAIERVVKRGKVVANLTEPDPT